MDVNQVAVNMPVWISHLETTDTMLVHEKNLSVRKAGLTGIVIGYVPGHGGDVFWVKHDGTNEIGAYSYTEFKKV